MRLSAYVSASCFTIWCCCCFVLCSKHKAGRAHPFFAQTERTPLCSQVKKANTYMKCLVLYTPMFCPSKSTVHAASLL